MNVIIKSGGNNLASVQYALSRIGCESIITDDPKLIAQASRVILPGVGSAEKVMHCLNEKNLSDTIRQLKQPVLGICLGMQLMYAHSEEGNVDCLNLIPGKVKKMKPQPNIYTPHMGWNTVSKSSMVEDDYFYFVHSYCAPINELTMGVTSHGQDFSSIVRLNNFMGVQFHPERSGSAGEKFLRYFMTGEWQ